MPPVIYQARSARMGTLAALLAVGVMSVACKDDATAPQKMVATNTTLSANATITSALAGTTFNFANGAGVMAPELANQNLALTFGGDAVAPTASLVFTSTSGAPIATVTTRLTFGSCIFAVTATTGTVPASMQVGQTVVVNPCNFNIGTAGTVANGVAQSRSIALLLGAASSANATVTVAVSPGGQLTLNGRAVGTVTLVPVTG